MTTLISYDHRNRSYFFADFDEAKAFERLFDGDFSYSDGGYVISI